jgi:hypothetical protein
MVNLSIVLLRQTESGLFGSSISALKAWFRAREYVLNTLKFSEQNAAPVFIKCTIYQVSWGESILLFAKFSRVWKAAFNPSFIWSFGVRPRKR